jgi:hypothetical protein
MKHHSASARIAWMLVLSVLFAMPPQALRAAAVGDAGGAEVWQLTVRPQAPTRPALRHALLTPVADQTPGNAAPMYLLATARTEQVPHRMVDAAVLQQKGLPPADNDDLMHYYLEELPLDKLPQADVEEFLRNYQTAFGFLNSAAQREFCRWDLPTRTQGFETLLPHLNGARHLANATSLRIRLHVARKETDEAIGALRDIFQMSQDLTQEGLLVQSLVATGIGALGCKRTREIVQQPDAPNLYWPLASLPRPFVDLRLAMEWERAAMLASFPQLKWVETESFSAEDWNQFVNRLSRFSAMAMAPERRRGGGAAESLGPAALGVAVFPHAKAHLLARGVTEQEIAAMPSAQVLGRYMLEQYNTKMDDMIKWTALPFPQAQPGLKQAEGELPRAGDASPLRLLTQAIPSAGRAAFSVARLDRQIAALRTVEALRAYAAGHDDKLPANLEALTDTPAPLDPTTGKSFTYSTEGNTATLESPAPPGGHPREALRIEVTLAK